MNHLHCCCILKHSHSLGLPAVGGLLHHECLDCGRYLRWADCDQKTEDVAVMATPALGAIDAAVAASTTAMVLRPSREDLGTATAVPPAMVPRCLDDVVVVARAKTPLLECLSLASEALFCFLAFRLIGMAMRINAELLMCSQKLKKGGLVM